MKLFNRLSLFAIVLGFAGLASAQQNTLTQTSLTTAIGTSAQTFPLAAYTNVSVTPNTYLYVDLELMQVLSVTTSNVTVQRGMSGTRATTHASGEMVLAGRPDWFGTYNAAGSCVAASVYVTPFVNIVNGAEWTCSPVTLIWGPGWSNTLEPPTTSAAVASAAGVITPSGQLFHVTGALAITGFTIPVGFSYGSFTIVPDGAFTTTAAGNIATASTAVVGRPMTFTFDSNTSKFYSSY